MLFGIGVANRFGRCFSTTSASFSFKNQMSAKRLSVEIFKSSGDVHKRLFSSPKLNLEKKEAELTYDGKAKKNQPQPQQNLISMLEERKKRAQFVKKVDKFTEMKSTQESFQNQQRQHKICCKDLQIAVSLTHMNCINFYGLFGVSNN